MCCVVCVYVVLLCLGVFLLHRVVWCYVALCVVESLVVLALLFRFSFLGLDVVVFV